MAPKAISPSPGKKASDTKAATKVLDSAQAVKTLASKKLELKDAMSKLAVAKKTRAKSQDLEKESKQT